MTDYIYSIEAKNVNKTFKRKNDETHALKNFNIKIKKGSIHGLLGPNGAGKSTFINILGGLVKKNTGNINICGVDIDKNPKLSKFKIGIVPQELNIDPFFTPFELLELQAGLYGISKKNRKTEEILNNVGLIDKKNAYARTLSGGMRRRLLVAKALVHNPKMLILDEPTAGVDVELRSSLWEYIKKINNQGTSICLTTHYLQEAEELCENITIIDEGEIIKDDSKKNLLNFISTKKVSLDLLSKIEIPKELINFNPIVNNGKLHLTYDKSKTSLNHIIKILNESNIVFSEMNTYESNLEDVFKKLIVSNGN
ncbi:ABC transporter ATP-binding protein [Pelagibacteraceae bacterium]|nr:ABC transporter ATP-binding protein [Pelagibacteraceae bacterium]